MGNLRIYYAVACEMAGMYVQCSNSEIMKGLDMLGELSLMGPKSQAAQNARIQRYSDAAETSIKMIADKVRVALAIAMYGMLADLCIIETRRPVDSAWALSCDKKCSWSIRGSSWVETGNEGQVAEAC